MPVTLRYRTGTQQIQSIGGFCLDAGFRHNVGLTNPRDPLHFDGIEGKSVCQTVSIGHL